MKFTSTRIFAACFALCLCALVAGCSEDQAPRSGPTDFEKISMGMTQAEVIEALGEPLSIEQEGNATKLVFFVSKSGSQEFVLIENDKVIKWKGIAILAE